MNAMPRVLIWDAPTRVFHWLMVLCFCGAYLTSESSRLLGVHLTLGYTMVALVIWRLLWGLLGTRYARFSQFVRGPHAVALHLRDMLRSHAPHPVGHNPLGAISILLMLLLTLAVVASGWVFFTTGAHGFKDLHEGVAGLMLGVVGVHLAGVVLVSLRQRENLAASMVHGRKRAPATQAIGWSWWPLAALLLAVVLSFWWMQWQNPLIDLTPAAQVGSHSDDD